MFLKLVWPYLVRDIICFLEHFLYFLSCCMLTRNNSLPQNNPKGLFIVYHTYLVPVGGWVVVVGVLGLQGCWYLAPADDDDDDDGDDGVCE